MQLRYRSAPRTHVGLVRKVNEDAVLARDDALLWIVADGMGGHDNGQWASQTLVAQFAQLDLQMSRSARGAAIVGAIRDGNRAINDAAMAANKQMGTTAVVVHCDGDDVLLLWVGDSRIYRLRGTELAQMTRDHTMVQDLVDRGALDPHEAETHPMSHVLSRAVGTEPELRYDSVVDKAQAGDRYLLCSDGLTKVVSDPLMAAILSAGSIEAAADRLIAEALERGAPDNTTLVVLSAEEATALGMRPAL
ncbi:PP2C family protein-serine/threonine phosphatase [Sphingomonas sp.]|uniref:PP2C family protein-serine/threonine phosphatase n=1 Tax=Sphingomonas sp. TaxID=28214 RepID=UPI0035BC4DED